MLEDAKLSIEAHRDHFHKTMDDHLTSKGIAHDAVQIVRGCGHDLVCLEKAVSYANFTFAAMHFH